MTDSLTQEQLVRAILLWWKYDCAFSTATKIVTGEEPLRNLRDVRSVNFRQGPRSWLEGVVHRTFPALTRQHRFDVSLPWSKRRRVFADFYDQERRIAFELDGPSHKSKAGRQRDFDFEETVRAHGGWVMRIENGVIEACVAANILGWLSRNSPDEIPWNCPQDELARCDFISILVMENQDNPKLSTHRVYSRDWYEPTHHWTLTMFQVNDRPYRWTD